MKTFINYHQQRGHVFGECWSKSDTDLMYVNIPKNATSWTKPNLQDWRWECYNYHTDNLYHKQAMVVLRDPVDRWLSGISEYLYLYHRDITLSDSAVELIFGKIAFDDHTEKQVYFLEGLDLSQCVFFEFGKTYREYFSSFLAEHNMPNRYHRYEYQHVSDDSPERKLFKNIFSQALDTKPKYLEQVKNYFAEDYTLINSIEYYAPR